MSQYTLKVKEVVKETSDAATIVFDNKDNLKYKSGQFLTFILNINGENLRRSYSLCSAHGVDKDLAVTVKKVANGKASNFLVDKIKEGDAIEVMEPMGVFNLETSASNKRDIVLIGAGSGITPLMSMLKSILFSEPGSKVYLIYANRDESSVIFESKLKEFGAQYSDRLQVAHVYSNPKGNYDISGRLNNVKILSLLDKFGIAGIRQALFFTCGPHGFMEEVFKAAETLKVPKEHVHKENFASHLAETPVISVNGSKAGEELVTIRYRKKEYKVKVPVNSSILEAALDENIDLPYSCQSGMCTACMGKCTSGKVQMSDPDGLSDNEVKKGYVLTCVARPVTSDVVIEID